MLRNCQNNSSIVTTAHSIAEEMVCKTLEQFLSIVELVAKKVEGKSDGSIETV